MKEAPKIVVGAMDATGIEEAEEIDDENAADVKSEGSAPAKNGKKPKKKGSWFKPLVSTLIALVTIMGAIVAWRANVAGSTSGDNDSSGLLALQNAEETRAVSYIKSNGQESSYVNYLRNRIIGQDMLNDGAVAAAPPDMQDYVARQITETLDLANSTKRSYFPGAYLNQDDQYNFDQEISDIYQKAQQNEDLNYQAHFDTSDSLSNKSMFLLSMLIVLAMALWLLALSEVLVSNVKYVTAIGGALFMLLGGLGAYLADGAGFSTDDIGAATGPVAWALAVATLLAAVATWALVASRKRRATATVISTNPPPVTTPYPGPPIPPSGTPYGSPPPYPPSQSAPMNAASIPAPVYVPATVGPPPPNPAPPVQNVEPAPAAKKAEKAKEEKEEEEIEEPFKRIVTVAIATVALIAALIAYLQADASNQAGSANRNAQQYATQSLGEQTYGTAEMTFHYNAVEQTWEQLELLVSSANNHNDSEAAKRYQDAADQIKSLSSMFDAPYFDPTTSQFPNDGAFKADLYDKQSITQSEQSKVQRDLHDIWDGKANAYIAHLTLLAVALALFGLALATSGSVRYIFEGAASLLVVATIVWAAGVYAQPVNTISDQAVQDYANAKGLEDGGDLDGAIKALTDALAAQPNFADALYERGNVYFDHSTDDSSSGYYAEQSNDTGVANKDYNNATTNLQNAVKDYEAARAAGRDDTFVDWDLGWSYYLLGQYDDAERIDRLILSRDDTIVGVRLNLGLALLAQDDYDGAELEYNTAIARTSDLVNKALDQNKSGASISPDLWYYLNASVEDLYNLLLRAGNYKFSFIQAPQRDKIINPDGLADEAFGIVVKLRDKTAAFQYLAANGHMPEDTDVTATAGQFIFGATVAGQSDEVDGSEFPYNTKSVTAYYTYTGILKGQDVMFKVYKDFEHNPQYDKEITSWQGVSDGLGQIVVTDPYDAYSEAYYQDPGLWTVEMYVDYKLLQINVFYIETQDETQQAQSQSQSPPLSTPAETPTPTTSP